MIPKILHTIWINKPGKQTPDYVIKNRESYVKHLSGWEIKLWDETNLPFHLNKYSRQAYESGELGFVGDFFRLWFIDTFGGVYVDGDVELLNGDINNLLDNDFFTAIENEGGWLGTAVLGGTPNNKVAQDLMKWYVDNDFILPNGAYNKKQSNEVHIDYFKSYLRFPFENKTQKYGAGFTIYDRKTIYRHTNDSVLYDKTVFKHLVKLTWVKDFKLIVSIWSGGGHDTVERIVSEFEEKYDVSVDLQIVTSRAGANIELYQDVFIPYAPYAGYAGYPEYTGKSGYFGTAYIRFESEGQLWYLLELMLNAKIKYI